MTQIGYVLSHEQFRAPELLEIGVAAEDAGFDMLWTSDHIHPWQDNQGHSGHAWITLAALGQRTSRIPFGTGVTCPTYRYHPAVVAHAFASLGVRARRSTSRPPPAPGAATPSARAASPRRPSSSEGCGRASR